LLAEEDGRPERRVLRNRNAQTTWRGEQTGIAKGAAMSDDNSLVPHVTLPGETLVRMMKPLAYRSAN